jgi:2-oxoglutarate ferredoxin oxidoreductase subunit alpha
LRDEAGLKTSYLRLRAYPFTPDLGAFIDAHDRVYVVEQNRDGQLFDLIRLALPADLVGRVNSIRHYNGQPIPAAAIIEPLMEQEAVPA